MSFSISPSSEHSGLISFRTDWFDLLAVQGTLKNLLQCYNLKAPILWCSAFFMDQLSHLYMTTAKTIALTLQTFVSKVMSLLCDMLSRFVTTFLTRSKHLLISWLKSPFTVISKPPINKICHCCHDGSRCHDLSFFNIEVQVNFFTLLFLIKRHFSSSSLSPIRVLSSAYRK